jgi:hypothetical protein
VLCHVDSIEKQMDAKNLRLRQALRVVVHHLQQEKLLTPCEHGADGVSPTASPKLEGSSEEQPHSSGTITTPRQGRRVCLGP